MKGWGSWDCGGLGVVLRMVGYMSEEARVWVDPVDASDKARWASRGCPECLFFSFEVSKLGLPVARSCI